MIGQWFNNLKISKKLLLIGVFASIVLLASIVVTSFQLYNTMIDERKSKVTNLVQTAASSVQKYYEEGKKGLLTQAQAQAKEALKKMIYNKEDFFWIIDYDCVMLMHPLKLELIGQHLKEDTDSRGIKKFAMMVD